MLGAVEFRVLLLLLVVSLPLRKRAVLNDSLELVEPIVTGVRPSNRNVDETVHVS